MVFDRDGRFPPFVGRRLVHQAARHLHRAGWRRLLHRRPGPHCPQVYARRQTVADAGPERPSLGHRSDEPGLSHHPPAGPPFHYPTNLALAPKGELYVSDGYGNARIHKFSAEGQLLFSWGEPGTARPFPIPHGIAVDRQGTVFVADRENSRIQLFSPDGTYLREWTDVARPCQVFIDDAENVFVAELGFRAGMWPGTSPRVPMPRAGA